MTSWLAAFLVFGVIFAPAICLTGLFIPTPNSWSHGQRCWPVIIITGAWWVASWWYLW